MTTNQEQDAKLLAEAADEIRELLAPVADLEALARTASPFTRPGAERAALAWSAHRAADLDTVARIHGVADRVMKNVEAQLTLYTNERETVVYMRRWWLERRVTATGRGRCGYYLHRFEGDDPAGLHDHPWPSASLMVSTGVMEHSHQGSMRVEPGTVYVRPARFRHRIRLLRDAKGEPLRAVSVIATGEREQSWGFETSRGVIVAASASADRCRTNLPGAGDGER